MRIVVLDGATLNPGDNPWTELARLGELEVHDRSTPAELPERAGGAEILVVNKVRLDEEQFRALPDLRFVTITATGHDCVNLHAARLHGVQVANVPVYGTDSVAQHVFAMLLHVLHRVDLHDKAIRDGEWSRCGDFSFWRSPLMELSGKSLGIVGLGRIGQRVARLADAFGMSVLAFSRRQMERPAIDSFAWADLEGVMRGADVITLHCPLNDATQGLINAQSLGHVRPHAILINASRGPLIVDADLAEALNTGRLAAAALDVVSEEPIPADSPLLQARNCFLTPHMAWATLEARQRLMAITVANVAAFLQRRPQHLLT